MGSSTMTVEDAIIKLFNKSKVVLGSYTGNEESTRTIELPFAPDLFILEGSTYPKTYIRTVYFYFKGGGALTLRGGNGDYSGSGLSISDTNLVDNMLTVSLSSAGTTSHNGNNIGDTVYNYVCIKF